MIGTKLPARHRTSTIRLLICFFHPFRNYVGLILVSSIYYFSESGLCISSFVELLPSEATSSYGCIPARRRSNICLDSHDIGK